MNILYVNDCEIVQSHPIDFQATILRLGNTVLFPIIIVTATCIHHTSVVLRVDPHITLILSKIRSNRLT